MGKINELSLPSRNETRAKKMREADIKKAMMDLIGAKPSSDNAEQGKFVQLMKGLAFSEDPKATEFMSRLMKMVDKGKFGDLAEDMYNDEEEKDSEKDDEEGEEEDDD